MVGVGSRSCVLIYQRPLGKVRERRALTSSRSERVLAVKYELTLAHDISYSMGTCHRMSKEASSYGGDQVNLGGGVLQWLTNPTCRLQTAVRIWT